MKPSVSNTVKNALMQNLTEIRSKITDDYHGEKDALDSYFDEQGRIK